MMIVTSKKMLLGCVLFSVSIGMTRAAPVANLESPVLLTPDDGDNLPLKKAAKFTWKTVTGSTKYRLIVSSDNKFSDYDSNKSKCLKPSGCFTAENSKPSYSILANQIVLAKKGSYFWQVQAINTKSRSKIKTPTTNGGEVRTFSVGGTGYSKIANNGTVLSDTATLGTKPTDWACTKDNATGLIWEIKTTDGGLHDSSNTYTWFQSQNSNGTENGGVCKGSDCDTDAYTKSVNKQTLCGSQNWRMASYEELSSLVQCSGGKYNKLDDSLLNGSVCAASNGAEILKATYFPDLNANNSWYWTNSAPKDSASYIWLINFNDGTFVADVKTSTGAVRLVHKGQ